MSALNRFEQFMENMVEGSVGRIFRSPVQPAEISKRLERAMESQQQIGVQRVIVPNVYKVFLNPQDFEVFEPMQAEVQREMQNYLMDLAAERNFTMLAHPHVELGYEASVPRRTIQVVAEMVEPEEGSTRVMTQTVSMPTGRAPVQGNAQLLLDTPKGKQPIPLETTIIALGRGLDNDVVLEDVRVSRHHAQLRYKARKFWVTDKGSTNGTFVNNNRVNIEAELKDGDIISLGGMELTFKEG